MHQYAFEVKLAAVVRITASNQAEALRSLNGIDAISLDTTGQVGNTAYHFTEASVDDTGPRLFEIDGKETE